MHRQRDDCFSRRALAALRFGLATPRSREQSKPRYSFATKGLARLVRGRTMPTLTEERRAGRRRRGTRTARRAGLQPWVGQLIAMCFASYPRNAPQEIGFAVLGRHPDRDPEVMMASSLTSPLTPFVDVLPLPPRLLPREHGGHLTVRIRAASHRFHRDLPPSRAWGFEGCVPGPTIEAERGWPVRVEWRNELDGALPGPGHGRAGRDRRRRRAGAVRAWAEWRHGRSARGGAAGLHGRAPARRPDAGGVRRLDGEHLGSGPARCERLSDGPARGAALVPRPRDGGHAVYRVRGPGRAVDRS